MCGKIFLEEYVQVTVTSLCEQCVDYLESEVPGDIYESTEEET